MAANRKTCLAIVDKRRGCPTLAAQFATLRGMSVTRWSGGDSIPEGALSGKGTLIALTAAAARNCKGFPLRACVEAGAVVHLSQFDDQPEFSLRPFADGTFRVRSTRDAPGYEYGDDRTLPHSLRRERMSGSFNLAVAEGLNGNCRTLAAVRDERGRAAPALFGLNVGAGTVIYDLNSQPGDTDTPIVRRLAAADGMARNAGSLVVANLASGYEWREPANFNITIDDRPTNFDYLGAARLERLMNHLNARCPGVHVDFAWTPALTHASRRYVEVVRRYGGGFVWHGFRRHVDHRELSDPMAELRQGERFVDAIRRRYNVNFQNVMIFPYERTTQELLHSLQSAGFAASVECANSRPGSETGLPGFMRYSTATHYLPEVGLPVLRRYPTPGLERPLMLALSALGHPIIAMAHPADVSLRRFAFGQDGEHSKSYFDHVLDFASGKTLRPASLKEIAADLR